MGRWVCIVEADTSTSELVGEGVEQWGVGSVGMTVQIERICQLGEGEKRWDEGCVEGGAVGGGMREFANMRACVQYGKFLYNKDKQRSLLSYAGNIPWKLPKNQILLIFLSSHIQNVIKWNRYVKLIGWCIHFLLIFQCIWCVYDLIVTLFTLRYKVIWGKASCDLVRYGINISTIYLFIYGTGKCKTISPLFYWIYKIQHNATFLIKIIKLCFSSKIS